MVPGKLTEAIPTLSVAVTENVTVWNWESVETTTLLSFTLNELIVGAVSSDLVTLIVTDELELFPAASVAVAVTVSLIVPKL